jgi:hypothetical protein
MIPPIACTTLEPAKSTAPWPSPQFFPACASHPPPHTQLAKRQYGNATQKENRQKFFQLQRSAIAPVGIVAVVSMNTIMKKNNAMTLQSSMPLRKNPLRPIKP